MNLNPVEWLKAKDLLVELVQVLTPLTERIVPASFFLSRRFLIPSAFTPDDFHPVPLRHPVRLLTDLHSVQKKVEKWIGEAPQETVEKEMAQRPVTKIENKPQTMAPLSKQAQKLLQQVQLAIEKLSTSTHIQNPVEEPLREAFRKLKPNLDRIIDSVTQDNAPEKNPPGFFRHPVPRTAREELIAKLVTSSKEIEVRLNQPEAHNQPAAPRSRHPEIHREIPVKPLDRLFPESQAEVAKSHILPKKIDPEKRRGEGEPQAKGGAKEISDEIKMAAAFVEKETAQQGPSEAKPATKPFEVIALPGAPFVSHAKNLLHPGKKKRKGFWFKGEEERQDHNNP